MEHWPKLPYVEWSNTLETLHRWMQIVGKVKLKCAPFQNQWWEVAFYLTANGITTGRVPFGSLVFATDFDFLNHTLTIRTSANTSWTLSLSPRSVADFYREYIGALRTLGINVAISPIPSELPDPIAFMDDTVHASYDPTYANRWWQILLQSSTVFDQFRSLFRGKSSPTQFFWGSFDLSGTRFSGKTVRPPRLNGELGSIMKYAENEENFAYGFWAGNEQHPEATYYVYLYPKPTGFESVRFGRNALFNASLAECIYPYDSLRKTNNPSRTLLRFLDQTYHASAKLAGWDIRTLTNTIPPQFRSRVTG